METAYSYVRFSHPSQAEGDSLRRQVERAEAYCRRAGLTLSKATYRDLGVSAFRGKNALVGNLGQVLKAVKSGAVRPGSALIVESIDRISRQGIDEGYDLIKSILKAGVRLVTLSPEREFGPEAVKSLSKGALEIQLILERAAEESERKSERVTAALDRKRAAAREGAVFTRRLPGWVEERGGRLHLIPSRAAVVRTVYRLASQGHGYAGITRRLNDAGAETFGPSARWNKSYVAHVLRDRRAVGEFQPMKGRRPDGKPVANYFPAVVSEADWSAARAGADQRKRCPTGRSGKQANLFAGMIIDARTGGHYCATLRVSGDGKARRVLVTTSSTQAGAAAGGFSLPVFEAAVLGCLYEIDPREVAGEGEAPNEVAVLEAQLERAGAKVADLEAALLEGDSVAVARVLRDQEAKVKELTGKLAGARQRAAHPIAEAWDEARGLMAALAKAPDPEAARLRLRAALRRTIKRMVVLVVPHCADRFCLIQVHFAEGGRREYVIQHRAGRGNQNGGAPGWWRVASLRNDWGNLSTEGPVESGDDLLLPYDMSTADGLWVVENQVVAAWDEEELEQLFSSAVRHPI
jgi:DNA invertase Pin-like site-specific DNA recombinase